MEICPAPPTQQTNLPPSIIKIKNNIRLDHDGSCNCCCCSNPQPACLKYVQPAIPKSFKPMMTFKKTDIPMESNTTHKLSYWGGPAISTAYARKPIKPSGALEVGGGEMTDETTHKASYLGNWCMPRKNVTGISPAKTTKQWLGRGPMQDVTTHKNDFTWKHIERSKPVKKYNNIYPACASMTDDTTYKMSYYASNCRIPVKSFKPVWSKQYKKSNVPMEGCTTYKLSYWLNEMPKKEKYTWKLKPEYHPPTTPLDDFTTYRSSYWPHREPVRKAFSANKHADNLLNAGCCFDDKTTYNSSYYGCGAPEARRNAIRPVVKPTEFSDCPMAHDTVHKLSYLGNWGASRTAARVKSPWKTARQWLGRGPMQDMTTQKHDFNWKHNEFKRYVFRPNDNFKMASLPLECCTTHKLSYYPTDLKNLVREKSYKPRVDRHTPLDVPMENETTMKLSYQPVEAVVPRKKAVPSRSHYQPPSTPLDDDTTYNLSYVPPGTLEPLSCDDPCPPSCDACCGGAVS